MSAIKTKSINAPTGQLQGLGWKKGAYGRYLVPRAIIRCANRLALSTTDLAIILAIMSWAPDFGGDFGSVTTDQLANDVNSDRKTVVRSLKRLRARGLLETHNHSTESGRRSTNAFDLRPLAAKIAELLGTRTEGQPEPAIPQPETEIQTSAQSEVPGFGGRIVHPEPDADLLSSGSVEASEHESEPERTWEGARCDLSTGLPVMSDADQRRSEELRAIAARAQQVPSGFARGSPGDLLAKARAALIASQR
jgi:DNA-binding MarR family transcriptional regulator